MKPLLFLVGPIPNGYPLAHGLKMFEDHVNNHCKDIDATFKMAFVCATMEVSMASAKPELINNIIVVLQIESIAEQEPHFIMEVTK